METFEARLRELEGNDADGQGGGGGGGKSFTGPSKKRPRAADAKEEGDKKMPSAGDKDKQQTVCQFPSLHLIFLCA